MTHKEQLEVLESGPGFYWCDEYVKSVDCGTLVYGKDYELAKESYAVPPPTYEPVVAVCPRCKGKLKVKASTRVWPRCPDCEETMERYRGDEEDSVN